MLLFGDLDRARHYVERALALDPNNAWAWTRHGFLLAYRGNPEEALQSFEKALTLSPLDPFSFNGFIGMGFAKFAAGHSAEAVQWTQRAIREKVGMTWAYRDLAAFNGDAGNIPAAQDALDEVRCGAPRRDDLEASRFAPVHRTEDARPLPRRAQGGGIAGVGRSRVPANSDGHCTRPTRPELGTILHHDTILAAELYVVWSSPFICCREVLH